MCGGGLEIGRVGDFTLTHLAYDNGSEDLLQVVEVIVAEGGAEASIENYQSHRVVGWQHIHHHCVAQINQHQLVLVLQATTETIRRIKKPGLRSTVRLTEIPNVTLP